MRCATYRDYALQRMLSADRADGPATSFGGSPARETAAAWVHDTGHHLRGARRVIAITRSKYGVPIRDVFFADRVHSGRTRVPLCVFQQTAHQHDLLKPVQTSVIDLTLPIEEIAAPISKNTHYKIRRAEREGL